MVGLQIWACPVNATKILRNLMMPSKLRLIWCKCPPIRPTACAKTLGLLLNEKCKTPEQMKAWSMNMGHEHLRTTMSAYMPVSLERQGTLMKAMREN